MLSVQVDTIGRGITRHELCSTATKGKTKFANCPSCLPFSNHAALSLYHVPSYKFGVQSLAKMGRAALDENTSSLKSFNFVIGSTLASTDDGT